jgi:hypothetical protein
MLKLIFEFDWSNDKYVKNQEDEKQCLVLYREALCVLSMLLKWKKKFSLSHQTWEYIAYIEKKSRIAHHEMWYFSLW